MMKSVSFPRVPILALMTIWAALASTPTEGRAQEVDALKLLNKMTDYVVAQKSISASVDTDIEIVTPELQKIQFTSSSKLLLSRPDMLRVERTGGYANVELVFDGTLLTLHGKHNGVFAQQSSPGTTDQLIERMRSEFSIEAPGADLLLTNSYQALAADVLDAKYIGQGVVGGVECDHLAFRNEDTDWQIWIERGGDPIPRKLVITSKAVTGAPQYTLVIKTWETDTAIAPDAFVFKAPADAKKVAFGDLHEMDELPVGIAKGGSQ